MFYRQGNLSSQFLWMQHIVGVMKLQQLAFRQFHAAVTRGASTAIWTGLHPDRITEALHYFEAPVCRTVIHHDYLSAKVSLL